MWKWGKILYLTQAMGRCQCITRGGGGVKANGEGVLTRVVTGVIIQEIEFFSLFAFCWCVCVCARARARACVRFVVVLFPVRQTVTYNDTNN